MNQWFYANKLFLNVKKTKYILFRPSACFTNITNQHLYIDNKPISRVGEMEEEKSFKFLGIHMDETLTWKHHIGKVCSKISHSNYIINKAKHILLKSSLHTLFPMVIKELYCGLVHPILENNSSAWNPCAWLHKDIDKLERVQHRCQKLSSGDLHLPPLAQRRMKADMRETFKLLNGHYKTDPDSMFNITRHSGLIEAITSNFPKKIQRLRSDSNSSATVS